MEWIKLSERKPEHSQEVICFNEAWVDEDFNPNGTRIGFLNGGGTFTTAHWLDYQDTYITVTIQVGEIIFWDHISNNTEPTHWMEMPKKPE